LGARQFEIRAMKESAGNREHAEFVPMGHEIQAMQMPDDTG
jgi:hypothetical protein